VYEAHLREAGFDDVRVEVITERTLPRFVDHLERLALQVRGERASLLRKVAGKYREHLGAGLEYVLVSARKANPPVDPRGC
jgi:hypothetical protein